MSDKSGFRLELIPNMYEIGLFRFVLKSRKSLRLSAGIALGVLLALYAILGYVLRHCSNDFFINAFLVLFLYLVVVGVAYIFALVLGDIFFAGPWLEKMRLGSKFVPKNNDDEKALIKNKSISFILFWGFSIAVLVLGCDFVTGSNLNWFHSYGGIIHSMKSDDPSERASVLKSLSNSYHDSKWKNEEIRTLLTQLVLDEDDSVRVRAAYIVGRAKILEGADNLVTLLRDDNASNSSQSEAAIALGRLEWLPARAHLLAKEREIFAKSHKDDERLESIIYAFYEMKEQTAMRDIVEMLQTCLKDGDCGLRLQAYAFFYLKSLRVKEAPALAFSFLESPHTNDTQKCYAADVLRFTSAKSDVPRLKKQFDAVPRDLECPVLYRKFHSEAAVILFEKDTMRALILRAVGNLKEDADYDWIWMIGSNINENMHTRKVAETYARALMKKP